MGAHVRRHSVSSVPPTAPLKRESSTTPSHLEAVRLTLRTLPTHCKTSRIFCWYADHMRSLATVGSDARESTTCQSSSIGTTASQQACAARLLTKAVSSP